MKILLIAYCKQCEPYYRMKHCHKANRGIYNEYEIPEWCPLPDAPQADDPIPYKGSQGFFNVPDRLLKVVEN